MLSLAASGGPFARPLIVVAVPGMVHLARTGGAIASFIVAAGAVVGGYVARKVHSLTMGGLDDHSTPESFLLMDTTFHALGAGVGAYGLSSDPVVAASAVGAVAVGSWSEVLSAVNQ